MNLPKYKRLEALLHRVTVKQQAKSEQSDPVCLQALEKYKKVENINTQNNYETTSKI